MLASFPPQFGRPPGRPQKPLATDTSTTGGPGLDSLHRERTKNTANPIKGSPGVRTVRQVSDLSESEDELEGAIEDDDSSDWEDVDESKGKAIDWSKKVDLLPTVSSSELTGMIQRNDMAQRNAALEVVAGGRKEHLNKGLAIYISS